MDTADEQKPTEETENENPENAVAEGVVAAPPTDGVLVDEHGDAIKPTDIVFDCPYCGHNHVIDSRGAGLQINCVECGRPMHVPIPEGMKIDDLDLSADELLIQLQQTRQFLNKREAQVNELQQALDSVKTRRTELERYRMTTLHRYAELKGLCQNIEKAQTEIALTLNRIRGIIAEEQQH